MEIVNVRIDDRLIHGQVAGMWTGTLKATRIMVVDDEVIKDDLRKRMLKMACPAGVKLSILNCETAAQKVRNGQYEGDRIFVIVKSPAALLKMQSFGYPLSEVTVGNMSNRRGTRQIIKTINVTEDDERQFRELADKGIRFYAQMVPSSDRESFMEML